MGSEVALEKVEPCSVDDRLIDSKVPDDIDQLRVAEFYREIGSWRASGSFVTYLADNVKVAELASTTQPVGETSYAEGEVLFEDDFEDGDMTGWLSQGGWSVVQDETGNNVLQGEVTVANVWRNALAGSSDWTDYSFKPW